MIWIYDIEVLPNIFTVLFVQTGQTDKIQKYIEADMRNDRVEMDKVLATINKHLFIIYPDGNVNDIHLLHKFLLTPDAVFVAYNSIHYDSVILDTIYTKFNEFRTYNAAHICKLIYDISYNIIHTEMYSPYQFRKDAGLKYNRNVKNIDLMELHHLKKAKISLKQVCVNLQWYNVEDYEMPDYTYQQFLDMYEEEHRVKGYVMTLDELFVHIHKQSHFERKLHPDHLSGLLHYFYNDVFATDALWVFSAEELRSRLLIEESYGLDCIGLSRSSTASKVIAKLYGEATGLKEIEFVKQRTWHRLIKFYKLINPIVSFRTEKLQNFLIKLKNITINPFEKDQFKEEVEFNGKYYTMALGGLHSVDEGKAYYATKDMLIKDADADSYYPYYLVNYALKAAHLASVILTIFGDFLFKRMTFKRDKNKPMAGIYKIFVNAIWGKSGDADSMLKDDMVLYGVTINCQLFLIMLIEDLELANFKVISANTDGVTALVPADRVAEYDKILNDWSIRTKYNMEVNNYDLYVRTAVNSYVCTINNGDGKVTVKRKGSDFNSTLFKEDLSKGYRHPVVAKAIEEFYVNKTPIKDTLVNHKNILDFCIAQRTGGQFKNQLIYIKDGKKVVEDVPKTIRYYVSRGGGALMKCNKNTGSLIHMLKGQSAVIYNKARLYEDISEFNINYNFYISKCNEVISRIENTSLKLAKKTSGHLFDDLEE
jgi:hypothetical protein